MRSKLLVQVFLALIGISVLLSSLLLERFWLKPFRAFVEREPNPIQKFARDLIVSTSCHTCAGSSIEHKIVIEAPSEMRIDQSIPVRFTYDEVEPTSEDIRGRDTSDRRELERRSREMLSSRLNVTLSGANFLVKPQEAFSVEPPKELPIGVVWTIKPEATGAHVIVCDFSTLIVNNYPRPQPGKLNIAVVTTIAGADTPARKQDGIVEVPITVLTEWGVSKWIVDVVKLLSAFTGFLLVTPSVWKLLHAIKVRALAVR